MQIRRRVGGATWLELTDTTGITLGADGSITVFIGQTVTEAPAWDAYSKLVDGEPTALGVYDLELIDSTGSVTRFLQGTVTVSPDVTREAL